MSERWTGQLHLTDTGGLYGRITDSFGMITELHGTRELGSDANGWRPGWIVTAHPVVVPEALALPGDGDMGIKTENER